MIGEAAAHLVKEVVRFLQRGLEVLKRGHVRVRGSGEFRAPAVEGGRLRDVQRRVGTEGGVDARGQFLPANLPVILERVGGVVGGDDERHAVFLQQPLRAVLRPGQQGVGFFPDPGGALLVDDLVDAEVAQELEMAPVIKRIAQRVGDGPDEGPVFFLVGRVAGAEALGYAVGTHGPPLVVVARQPDVVEIAERVIFRDQLRGEMTVIIVDRLRLGVGEIELARRVGLEEKILRDERLHGPKRGRMWRS